MLFRSGPIGVTAGFAHSCAVLGATTVKCWGEDDHGRLGNTHEDDDEHEPVTVRNFSKALVVSAGTAHTCALRYDGLVGCWGRNGSGQLGDNSTTSRRTPVPVSGLSTAVAVGVGNAHSCAVLADGTVRCWGSNVSGQLGNGGTANSLVPVPVSGLSGATAVTAGLLHSCARIEIGRAHV